MNGRMAELPDLSVQSFAACEVQRGFRLQGAAVDGDTVYLVLAGTMYMRVPGARLTAPAGSLVVVPPGLPPDIAPTAGPAITVAATRNCLVPRGGLLVFDAAHGGAGDLRVVVGRVNGGLSGLLVRQGVMIDDEPLVGDLSPFPLALGVFQALIAELDVPDIGIAQLSASLMKTCLLLFMRSVGRGLESDSPAVPASGRLGGVVAAILARPSARYNLEALAAMAGMSRATFSRHFRDATGASPMEFVIEARLKDAATKLRGTALSIKQVAAESGFPSRSHFSRAFIASFGVNPSAFRSQGEGGGQPPMVTD